MGAKVEFHDFVHSKIFEDRKNLLTYEPILIYPNFTEDCSITIDGSGVAIGALLFQGPVGRENSIAFASRSLNEAEQIYSTIEKELLATVYVPKIFRCYILSVK